MQKELENIIQITKSDIQTYKEILSEALRHQLTESIETSMDEIFDTMKQIANKGKRELTIYFVLEHIYKTTFVYEGDFAVFSLEHCINDYLYEDGFFKKKQIKYKNINFKQFYESLNSKVNLNEMKLIKEIIVDNPLIITNLIDYLKNKGLSVKTKPHEYFLVIDLSF